MLSRVINDTLAQGSFTKRGIDALRSLGTTHSYQESHPQTILQALSPDTVAHLKRHGYAVQDNMLDSTSSNHLRNEIKFLISNKFTSPNKTHILQRHPKQSPVMQTYAKHSVIQAEVPHLPSSVSIPYLRILNDDPSLAAFLNVYWPKLTIRNQAVKVQRATGENGCFPIHIDSAPEADRRIVTALLYPHEHWTQEGGGALRIYKTPVSHVDILPIPGRLVLLSSTLMHHRVLSAEHHRFAITLWLSGTLQSSKTPSPTSSCLRNQAAQMLLQPKYRDFIFRLALQDEWEASLSESHPEKEARDLMLQFRNNVETIRKRLPDALCKDAGLEGQSRRRQVEELLKSQKSVVKCYRELEEEMGDIPFFW
ncbi:unnamed protein product [Agarophyton chilense]